jgi:dienelactone hydrolase
VRRILIIVVVVVAVTTWLVMPYVTALAILIDLSGQDMPMRRWLPVSVAQVTTRDVEVPTRHGTVSARLYIPEGRSHETWIVVPGVHAGGVDEPRLARLATRLAGTGITVLSLPLPDLRNFRIVGRSTDQIEDAVVWTTADGALARDGSVGLVGVSFGGGLAMVAAGRPAVADRIDRVVSFGGHGDLPRVIDYLCTGRLPDGTEQPAHDYGVAILLLGSLPHLVPPDQVAALDEAIRAFLDASIVDDHDRQAAAPLFARARQLSASLPEPAAAIMRDVNARDATRLGPLLLPFAELVGGDPALSAERSPIPRAPVFLVHGAADTVIPQSETVSLAAHLRAQGHIRVTSLLSPAISHADPSTQLTTRDVWELIRIWVAIQR